MAQLKKLISHLTHGRIRTFLSRLYYRYQTWEPELEWTEPETLEIQGQELTLKLEREADPSKQSQPQSYLINLPREIRDQIWQECLGGMNIYLDLEVSGRYSQASFPRPAHRSKRLLCIGRDASSPESSCPKDVRQSQSELQRRWHSDFKGKRAV